MVIRTDGEWKKVEAFLMDNYAVNLICDGCPVELYVSIGGWQLLIVPKVDDLCYIEGRKRFEIPSKTSDWKKYYPIIQKEKIILEKFYRLKLYNKWKNAGQYKAGLTAKQIKAAGLETQFVEFWGFPTFTPLKRQYRTNFKRIEFVPALSSRMLLKGIQDNLENTLSVMGESK